MKHELLYETQAAFNAAQGNSGNVTSVTPGVAYIAENNEVGFNKTSDILIIIYEVNDISSPTKLYNASGVVRNLKEIIVDKTHIPASEVTDTYQFNETGLHTVRFLFSSFNLSTAMNYAFANCTEIKIVKFPESVTTFACVAAFSGCTNLEEINIPSGVRNWGNSFFTGCSSVRKVHIKDLDTYLGYGFGNVWQNPLCASNVGALYVNGELVTDVVFPESSTTVGSFLFYKNKGIRSVQFSPNTTSIGASAFIGCTSLTGLTIPAAVDYSGQAADAGDGIGTLHVLGNYIGGGGNLNHRFAHILVDGGVLIANKTNTGHQIGGLQGTPIKTVIVKGDFSGNKSAQEIYNYTMNNLEFVEIMGTITPGDGGAGKISNGNILKSGCIFHLGYNGIAGPVSYVDPGNPKLSKIYVGDGSSQEHDQAILDQYLADESWATYTNKLDLWYNYHGEYRKE